MTIKSLPLSFRSSGNCELQYRSQRQITQKYCTKTGKRGALHFPKPIVISGHPTCGRNSMNRFNAHGSILFMASDGREYEIRHTADTSLIKLRVFRDNLLVNRFCYTTTFETGDEFAVVTGENVIDQLVRKAKSDVEQAIGLS
jgi:hypothetical protein